MLPTNDATTTTTAAGRATVAAAAAAAGAVTGIVYRSGDDGQPRAALVANYSQTSNAPRNYILADRHGARSLDIW